MKKQHKKSSKKIDKYLSRLLYIMMTVGVIHYYFFDELTIGHDNRYNIYIFWLPMLLGAVIVAIYFFNDWLSDFKRQRKIKNKVVVTFLYFLMLPFLSYLFVGQCVHVTWNYINKQTANEHIAEIIYCDVRSFNSGKSPSISFQYLSQSKSFRVSHSDIKEFRKKSPKNYMLEIKARKGIWNYYVVEEWDIVCK